MTFEVRTADVFDFLYTFESGSVDIVHTDPDYGITPTAMMFGGDRINKKGVKRKAKPGTADWVGTIVEDVSRWVPEVERVLTPGGHFIVWTRQEMEILPYLMGRDQLVFRRILSWNKTNPAPCFNTYSAATETAVWLTKKGRRFQWKSDGNNRNYFEAPVPRQETRFGHPTAKSVDVCQYFMRRMVKEGDLMVDPFCGSGAIMEAGLKLKLRVVGADLDPQWAPIVKGRLSKWR